MLSKKLFVYTSVFLVFCVLTGVLIFEATVVYGQIKNNWSAFIFTYNHPKLVSSLSLKYASDSAQLEQRLTTYDKSSDDKLKDAIAEQLK